MKKWLKRISVIGASLLAMVALAACGRSSSSNSPQLVKKGTLTVGLEGTYAPYSYRENGKLTGFEVDMARALAKKMGYKVKFVPTKWDSLIAGVGSHKFDMAINNIAMTPERQKAYLFSTPYIYSKTSLIMKKDNNDIKNVNDIKGKKIAAATGTANADNVKKFGGDNVSSPDFATAMSLIRQGRVQAAMNSKEAFLYYQRTNNADDLKEMTVPTSKIPSQKIGILMAKNNKGLKKKTDKALNELRKDGTLKRLSDKYFQENITEK
ncbi:putative cystine-binding periplasmic protein [Limosilactobacillus coleohominis 101-4-CHN]|uniref:Putative cystine-binding periplasmic protein n=1 Tax=Limosilactobacillus coleohominis 101-4-CHN TaxID=575594 RepID=C7XXQ4_9LACO|nr:transporter substrate-binding domain-containing protein [Limosilactobacillus coleohominis]EEU29674.1 putative cystine-binding periplasmic protein [Limosilactobacillus coleohominis 101-4-CHN]HJA46724.1 transporter substrate-binding domain-containing protein [Candidatus Limosilactobacillus excrementigallinarum]